MGIRLQKEVISAICGPICELIGDSLNLVAYFFDAEYSSCRIALNQPVPECRAKIQSVVEVLCLNEHVGVEQVSHLRHHSQTASQLLKGFELCEAEHSKGIAMQRLTLKSAYDKRPRESLANTGCLSQVKVAAALF